MIGEYKYDKLFRQYSYVYDSHKTILLFNDSYIALF